MAAKGTNTANLAPLTHGPAVQEIIDEKYVYALPGEHVVENDHGLHERHRMNRDIWGVFHDGVIRLIEGTVPGTLTLEIEIDYLRRMFPEAGDRFVVTLLGCSKFVYTEDNQPPREDVSHIQSREPEILYVTSEKPLVLDCNEGILELEYSEMTVALESGQAVSYESLAAACRKYWTDWKSRTGSGA